MKSLESFFETKTWKLSLKYNIEILILKSKAWNQNLKSHSEI